jgi:hypothetical protein
MTKPSRSFPRPLSDVLHKTINERFAQHGFASSELVTRWADIVGPEIASHSEPTKIQWPRPVGDEEPEPATLILRVEGPSALEIQHLSGVILERVNRFFGWPAVGHIALRQAPLRRHDKPTIPSPIDTATVARIAASLPEISDDNLKAALARLGAAIQTQ